MPDRRRLGREAEDQAAAYLLSKGYTLITRRFTVRGGEIDLIALDGDVLVFVEVKWRERFSPEEAVDSVKVRRLTVAANAYLATMEEQNRATRFDLVAMDRQGIRHYEGYF